MSSVTGFFDYIVKRDWQKQSEWVFQVEDPAGATGDLSYGNLVFRVKSVSLPFPKLSTEVGGDGMVWYNIKPEHEAEMTLELYEDSSRGFQSYKYFNEWYKQVFNHNTRTFMDASQNAGRNGKLAFHYYKGGVDTEGMIYKIEGMRPTGIQDLTLDYSNGEALTFTCSFVVRRVIDQRDITATTPATTNNTGTNTATVQPTNTVVVYPPELPK